MKALAKNVDAEDVEKVLKVDFPRMTRKLVADLTGKNDRRYTMFDHVPEQRERWIKVKNFRKTRITLLTKTTDVSSPTVRSPAFCTCAKVVMYSVVNKSRPVRLQAVINCHHGTVNLRLNVELTRWRSDRINSDSRSTATVDSECVGAPSLSSPLLFSRALLRPRTLRMYLRRNTTTRSATRSLREFNSDSGTERCRSFKENCH